jgi:hypothetical protein
LNPKRKTPAWLWLLFIVGMSVFAFGSFLDRASC